VVNSIVSSLNEVIQRPRPMGIEILGPWKGFAMPSLPLAILAAFLVSTLYANVPAGRARQAGKVVVAGLLFGTTCSRLYLAQDAPSDALIGIVIGVALPLAAFRLLASNEVFPVTYHRGRTAHLDVTGARGEAIVRALNDQLGLIVKAVKPLRPGGLRRFHAAAGHDQGRPGHEHLLQAVLGHPRPVGPLVQAWSNAAVRTP
jgi:hypothetical protein